MNDRESLRSSAERAARRDDRETIAPRAADGGTVTHREPAAVSLQPTDARHGDAGADRPQAGSRPTQGEAEAQRPGVRLETRHDRFARRSRAGESGAAEEDFTSPPPAAGAMCDAHASPAAEERPSRLRDGLVTLRRAAGYLGVSDKTVRRLVSARKLPSIRVGRVLRFQPADLFRFVEAWKE